MYGSLLKKKLKTMEELESIHKDLGCPGDDYKSIHVAGTNGKGTVALNIAKGLEKAGFKVGLFVSPHFECVNERISINQKWITDEEMEDVYKRYKPQLEGLLFFGLFTILAYIYFSEKKVDYAVIETGIGGLLDSTNIINSSLSVITNISFDHCDKLGDTLPCIAYQKAGVIKENSTVILGPTVTSDVFTQVAAKKKAKIIKATASEGMCVAGDFIKENKLTADTALAALGVPLIKEIYSLPGRFEIYGNVIFDMAHNEAAFISLGNKIKTIYKGKKIIAVWNMLQSKDLSSCLEILGSYVEKIYFFPFPSDRLITTEKAVELGLQEYKDQEADIILVCGSIYFMSEAKKYLVKI